jgi:predicted SprT family Zn-dependent metalloprotease
MSDMTSIYPTKHYGPLYDAYEYFNENIFRGVLPGCVITMQRHRGAYGFFAKERFRPHDGEQKIDEIALNPTYLNERPVQDSLSTLVHEMVHQWIHHFDKPSRAGYHNKKWASKMREIGLTPSSTGAPGGKDVGQKVSHFISENGAFDLISANLLKTGFVIPYVERVDDDQALKATRKMKAASKTRYTCPHCDEPQVHIWAKPGVDVRCGICGGQFAADAAADDWERWSPWREPGELKISKRQPQRGRPPGRRGF